MSRLKIAIENEAVQTVERLYKDLERRIVASPPGICPVDLALNFLRLCHAQTCGKCVPCRIGLGQLATYLEDVLDGRATMATLGEIERLAKDIEISADCAIGTEAARMVLRGLDGFRDEYVAHIQTGNCTYHINQPVPCVALCPAGVDIPGYIALIREGRCADAVRLIRKDNPFPTACALICEHPCEARCRRNMIDDAVNIRGLKRYAVDNAGYVPQPDCAEPTGKKVAIVGGGPSGLTCAYFCALMGHEVHVLEMRKQLGGMMRYGIPAYRFPRERLDEDIRAIVSAGNVTVRTECHIDAEGMRRLSEEYDAVYAAIGAQGGKTLKLDGADAEGVMSAVDLLTKIGDDEYPDFTGKDVVVVGGGNVAMDCARTSVRAGAASVTVAYRRRLEDMTALRAEIDSAMQEGVEMMTLQAPDHIEVENGQAVALYTQPQFIGPVKRGRPAPQKADKPLVRVPADVVLIAVGQDIESAPFEEAGMQADRTYFEADDGLKSMGSLDNVFVGGDCQTGPASAIKAIAAGKVAARNIDHMLGFNHTLDCGVTVPPAQPNDRAAYGRVEALERPARERKNDFDAVEVPMSTEEAMQECGRCLRCDHFGAGACEGGRIQYA